MDDPIFTRKECELIYDALKEYRLKLKGEKKLTKAKELMFGDIIIKINDIAEEV